MKVQAKELLYYNNRRYREGQQFDLLNEKDFTPKIMESLEPKVEKPKVEKHRGRMTKVVDEQADA